MNGRMVIVAVFGGLMAVELGLVLYAHGAPHWGMLLGLAFLGSASLLTADRVSRRWVCRGVVLAGGLQAGFSAAILTGMVQVDRGLEVLAPLGLLLSLFCLARGIQTLRGVRCLWNCKSGADEA